MTTESIYDHFVNWLLQLERIQNKMLYQQYLAKKKLLDSQNPQGTQNERELWHGTAPEAVNSINSFGFNRSYCGKNGKLKNKLYDLIYQNMALKIGLWYLH